MIIIRLYIIVFLLSMTFLSCAQHPGIILTKAGVEKIKSEPFPPVFDQVYQDSKVALDRAIEAGFDVPIPKDMAGGYTHEIHKQNYRNMHLAGSLYQISGEDKYAEYIKLMLLAYVKIYSSLPIHPTQRSYSTGKLFWQCLNDANWIVYSSQAYDAIYNYLSKAERDNIENEFLKPYSDFISVENPQFFNRVHNHSTWGNAAVGMMALVMNDEKRLHYALYGLPIQDKDKLAKDNDGGFIYEEGKAKAGFFAQMDYAFSPDGYYNEGPYYQRYAMLPFLLFAQALNNKKPELKIFEYRDGLLIKAVEALIIQTNDDGEFFPINDAQKGMSIKAQSVVTAVDIAYGYRRSPQLLAAAKIQNSVLLDQSGFEVAKDLAQTQIGAVTKKSIKLTDGKDGDEGALMIIRAGADGQQISAAFKCTSQGLGHGHYDKLSYSLYDGSTELLQDFGAARWVNIDQKGGGRYLPENNTWAKQTIAHNTLVVDKTSHFGGVYELANVNHSEPLYFHIDNEQIQVAGAKEVNAYEDVELHRILILWQNDAFVKPLLIDVFSAYSNTPHTYDMPFQHAAQIMKQNFEYKINDPIKMGDAHGYQHLFKEASGQAREDFIQVNLMKDEKFYTLTSTTNIGDEIILARAGASDPEFNIRKDPLLILRKNTKENATFLSVIESHGVYSRVSEVPLNPYSNIQSMNVKHDSKDKIIFVIKSLENKEWVFDLNKVTGKIEILLNN